MSHAGDDRRKLAATFDTAADLYQRARPEYPSALFDHLLSAVHLPEAAHVLEVGCGTGKATLPLARRGFRITALEPGANLATVARHALSPFPVEVLVSSFEDWDPAGVRFDLLFGATVWHWLDPTMRYRKAAEALKPAGYLAFWTATHVFPDGGDPFFDEIQHVYEQIGESGPGEAPRPRPGELPDDRTEIEETGLFRVVNSAQFDWETVHDAEGYIDLLNTFSGHIAMQPWQRDRLYSEIRVRLARRPDGLLRRHWGAVLHVAQRLA